MSEDKRVIGCPVCHSTDTEDVATWCNDNINTHITGRYVGQGPLEKLSCRVCNSCGVYFKDVSKHE